MWEDLRKFNVVNQEILEISIYNWGVIVWEYPGNIMGTKWDSKKT